MSKKALPVIIITVCLLFAGCKAPADQEQKNNTGHPHFFHIK